MEPCNPLHFLRGSVRNDPEAFGRAVVANYPKRIEAGTGATDC